MKLRFNNKYLTIAMYTLFVAIFGIAFFFLCLKFDRVSSSIGFVLSKMNSVFYGIIIALTLFPFYNFFSKIFSKMFCKKKNRPKTVAAMSIISTYLLVILIIAVIILGLVPFVSNDFTVLRDTLPGYVNNAKEWVNSQLERSSVIKEYYEKLLSIVASAFDGFKNDFQSYIPGIIGAFSSFISEVSDIVIGVILSVYFLICRKRIAGIINKIFVAILPINAARHLSGVLIRLYRNVMEYVSTRVLDSVIVGGFCYFFTWIFGVPFFSVISVLVFFLNIIPVFGPVIGIALAAFIVALADPIKLIPLLIILFALLILDRNVVETFLIRKTLRPNIGLSIVILILGWQLFGFAGIIFSIPLYATLAFEFRMLLYYLLRKKGLYEDPKYDVTIPNPQEEVQEQRTKLINKWNHMIHILDLHKKDASPEDDEESQSI